jgi:hypothetical protein
MMLGRAEEAPRGRGKVVEVVLVFYWLSTEGYAQGGKF